MPNLIQNLINKLKRRKVSSSYRRRFISDTPDQNVSVRIKEFFKDKSRLGMLLIVFILFIFAVFLIVRNLYALAVFEPQIFGDSALKQQNSWNGSDKMTILFIGTDKTGSDHRFIDHLSIYSMDPRENKLSIFVLNPDIKVTQSTLGYTLHYRTVLNNREIESDKLAILIKSVENLLAIKIDRYLMADKNSFPEFTSYLNPTQVYVPKDITDEDTLRMSNNLKADWKEGQNTVLPANFVEFAAADDNGRDDQLQRQQYLIEAMSLNLVGVRSVLYLPEFIEEFQANIYTNMGKWEIYNLGLKLLNIKSDDMRKGFLRESAYNKVIDIGFYEAVSPDINAIDKDINNIFFDMKVFKEQARIEVLNGSDISGLATNRKRWVENIGGRVIHKGNSYEKEEVTKIYCSKPEDYSITISELRRFLGASTELVSKDYPNRHVGEIVIVLGSKIE